MPEPFPCDTLSMLATDLHRIVCPHCGGEEYQIYCKDEVAYLFIRANESDPRLYGNDTLESVVQRIECIGCERVLWVRPDPARTLSLSDIQVLACKHIGRELNQEEVRRATTGVECGLDEVWSSIVETAVELAIEIKE